MRLMMTLALLAFGPAAAAAQGWIEPRPGFPGGVVKLRTAVVVRVSDRVARIEVEEWFRNTGGGLAEGDYLYPLAGEAVFSDVSLFQGDEELRGETMDAEEARRIYEEIVRRKRDPALIELVGHGLLRARVFPIGAGETRKLTLRYTQLLDRAGDAHQFRYSAFGRARGTIAPGAQPAPLDFSMVVEEAARYAEPFSATHSLVVRRDEGRLRVRLEQELTSDVAIFLPLARPTVGVSLATYRTPAQDGYFMLTLTPGAAPDIQVPRDLTVVVDVSGSMAGSKIEQAKGALRQLIGTLGADDRFRLIAFGNDVRTYAADWRPATANELGGAREWIAGLQPAGGTNIEGALEAAFRGAAPDNGRLAVIVFLTDGLPTIGERDPERLAGFAERQARQRRVFAFGIGYDVNTYLLDRLGAAGRGSAQYVQPGEDVEAAVSGLALKIRHPVLTDLEIVDAPAQLREIYPAQLPDLFSGEELVVFGRYHEPGAAAGTLSIVGRRAGRAERFTSRVDFAEVAHANDYIPRLWASRKLGELTRRLRLEGPDRRLEEEIRTHALRYGLLSEFTAHLVQEPETMVAELARDGVARRLAPQAATGRAAVAGAEVARRQRESSSVADLIQIEQAAVPPSVASASELRRVAARLFRLVDGVWTDAQHTPDSRTVAVQAFSQAYFELLRALPELEPYLAAFDRMVVAGERVAIRIDADGRASLSREELQRITREFRAVADR
ncbi:MAG: VIT domain-containing protein [Longimicrobiales bacterium]